MRPSHSPPSIGGRGGPDPLSKRKAADLMTRILIASPDSRERTQIRHYLSEQEDLEVAGVAIDGQEAIQLTLQLKPDLAILSAAMPVLDGFQSAEMIRLAAPE